MVKIIVRLLLLVTFSVILPELLAQTTKIEIDGVMVKEISPKVVRVYWQEAYPESCGDTITYSVHRGTKEDFEASDENQIVAGINVSHYITHEPKEVQTYYYRVMAIHTRGQCIPPTLKSGYIVTYPLDLGVEYVITIGNKTETCNAISTAEIQCSGLQNFHAVIANQSTHEFLIGCLSTDFEDNNWTCVNLKLGSYHIAVHSMTATIFDSGYSKINIKTGKSLGPITPEFSVLALIK